MGQIDRTMRFIIGVMLIATGLFLLEGWQGNLSGIFVSAFALMPVMTGLTGFCPAYIPFGISTLGKEKNSSEL